MQSIVYRIKVKRNHRNEDTKYVSNCNESIEKYFKTFIANRYISPDQLHIMESNHKTTLEHIYKELKNKDQTTDSGVLCSFKLLHKIFSFTWEYKVTITKILVD
jgi:hypothetical protein